MIDIEKIITEIQGYLFVDYDSSPEALDMARQTLTTNPWQSSTLKAMEICSDLAVDVRKHCFAIKSILNNNGIL